jgi:hypothetical protein
VRLDFEADIVHGFKEGTGTAKGSVFHGKIDFQIL